MLWKRFKRMVRSNVGRLRSEGAGSGATGASRLEEKLRALRSQDSKLPEMEENLVTVKGHVSYLEKRLTKLRRQEAEQAARVQASEKHGAVAAGAGHEARLAETRREIASTERELASAREALERAEAVKKSFVDEKARMVAEAQVALEEAEAENEAELQEGIEELQEAGEDARYVAPEERDRLPDPPAPPSSGGGLDIKVKARGADADDETGGPQKTIGPPADGAASETPRATDAPAAKTLGPAAPEEAPAASDPSSPRPSDEGGAPSSGGGADSPPARKASSAEPTPEEAPATQPTSGAGDAAQPGDAAGQPDAATDDAGGDALLGELERLGQLLEQGALSREEFEQAKRKLLDDA